MQDQVVYVSDVPDSTWPTDVDQRCSVADIHRAMEDALGDNELSRRSLQSPSVERGRLWH